MNADAARRILYSQWIRGDLGWLLYPHQLDIEHRFRLSSERKFVLLCSRRLGKSAWLLNGANALGLTRKRAIIRYGAATQKDVREIIHPLMRMLTAACPEAIRPVWREQHQKYLYPATGSELVVSGLDEGRADSLRGTSMDLGIIDEAGFVEDLDYVIRSVLMPQLLTTGGRIILSSTAPRSPSHAYVPFMEEARARGALVTKTIYDDSRPEVIARIPEWMAESGGAQSTTWRREYLCEIITDEDSALIPEFTDAKAKGIVKEWVLPPFSLKYTVMDLGLIDYTAVVFGYVDFSNGKNVIVDEYLINRQDSKHISDAIRKKEIQLWGADAPIRRFADGPAITVWDFNKLHGLDFVPVKKDELDAQLNTLRLEIQSESLIIHPRCENLVRHLKYGVWDKAHRKFDRSSTYGHYDLVAAVMYFVRHTNKRENPYPVNYAFSEFTHFQAKEKKLSTDQEKALETMFNLKFRE